MMMNLARLLLLASLLAGCQTMRSALVPLRVKWSDYVNAVEQMPPGQLQEARTAELERCLAEPDDWNRMRAAYVLSRPGASGEQLSRSRELLAEVSGDSELSPMRNLLDEEVQRTQELRVAQARSGEFQDRVRKLETELKELRLKMDALMKIEQKMVESQEQSDDFRE